LHESAIAEGVARLFAKDATLVVTIGATVGKVSSLPHPGSCNQQITAIEWLRRRVNRRFATYQIKRLEPVLRAIAPSATLPILDRAEVSDLMLALPPLNEQRVIARFLDNATAEIDTVVRAVEAAIERLQEYRTALITAAVTGKVDVRGAAS
jgi:type I restriction enzyme S subunit